jgi:hypothetical protein
MEMAFYLLGPEGVIQWKVAMLNWIPSPVNSLGGLPVLFPNIDDIMAIDLGYHWPTPTYEGQTEYGQMECDLLPGGKCYYDGSGLNAGPVLERFLRFGPHAVWSDLARFYQATKTRADELS